MLSAHLNAQAHVDFLKALGSNDVTTASSYLSNTITLCLEDDVFELNKEDVTKKLARFVTDNEVVSKKILHKGKSSDKGSGYNVARFKTNNGTFRVFAYSETEADVQRIKEIRIDKM